MTPKITINNSRYSYEDVENLVASVVSALEKLELDPEKAIALHVDISLDSVSCSFLQ